MQLQTTSRKQIS